MSWLRSAVEDTRYSILDLWFIVLIVGLTVAVVILPDMRTSPMRVIVSLVFVLFAPGYAFIAALFPEYRSKSSTSDTGMHEGVDGLERAVLSFGASIALVSLVSLCLHFTPRGITLIPIVALLSCVTLILTALATIRRSQVLPANRVSTSLRSVISACKELFNPESRPEAALNIGLIMSLIVAASTVTFAVAAPIQGETYTELSLLTETDDGKLVANDYPQNLTQNKSENLVVSITNKESEQINYTLLIELQRVSIVDGNVQVDETNELHQFQPTLTHKETWRQQHLITPEMVGERLRIQYLLYRGHNISNQETNDPYRTTYLWVNVTEPNADRTTDNIVRNSCLHIFII